MQWVREADQAGTTLELRTTSERKADDDPILNVTSAKGEIGKIALSDYVEARRRLLNEAAA